jgi:hypothetical protein
MPIDNRTVPSARWRRPFVAGAPASRLNQPTRNDLKKLTGRSYSRIACVRPMRSGPSRSWLRSAAARGIAARSRLGE